MTVDTPSTSWRTVSTGVVESAGCGTAASARAALGAHIAAAVKSSAGLQVRQASKPNDRFMDPSPVAESWPSCDDMRPDRFGTPPVRGIASAPLGSFHAARAGGGVHEMTPMVPML